MATMHHTGRTATLSGDKADAEAFKHMKGAAEQVKVGVGVGVGVVVWGGGFWLVQQQLLAELAGTTITFGKSELRCLDVSWHPTRGSRACSTLFTCAVIVTCPGPRQGDV
jgi:hypothetical protein